LTRQPSFCGGCLSKIRVSFSLFFNNRRKLM
jgi:hypothetical protein